MLSLFFAISFAISNFQHSECDRSILNSDEKLYQEILLSSNDSNVKLKYLEKFGECIKVEGLTLTEVRNIPVVEVLDCKEPLKKTGSEVFFEKGKLCSRSVQFFPSRNVLTLNNSLPIVLINEKWQAVQGKDTTLFYNKTSSFSQLQDPEGRILIKKNDGLFTDSLGKSAHPNFIYDSGSWSVVYPLKELFEIKVSPDNSFSVKMITESAIPYDKDKLIEIAGLKASDIIVETPLPNNYFIRGNSLKGIRIPFLSVSKGLNSFHGTYVFRFFYKGITPAPAVEIKGTDHSIRINRSLDFKELILTVTAKELDQDEINKIKAVINKEVPSFHITKSNADR